MSDDVFTTCFSSVTQMMFTLFGYLVNTFGTAAMNTVFVLCILSAVFRLIVKPLVGYSIDLRLKDVRSDMRKKYKEKKIGKGKKSYD